LKKQFGDDDIFNLAKRLCKEHVITDLDILFDCTVGELKENRFPIGIIKKITPFLKPKYTFE
jgi:hypothetical protein